MDLLIGADNPELLRSLKEVYGGVDQPIARLTPLGWTCLGKAVVNTDEGRSYSGYNHSFHAKLEEIKQ